MGSDAKVYVFDYDVYVDEVVLFHQRLISHGSVASALDGLSLPNIRPLASEIERYLAYSVQDGLSLKPADLDNYCTYLGEDLRVTTEAAGLPSLAVRWAEWDERACKSVTCPAKFTCPYHIRDGGRQSELLSSVLGVLVSAACLGPSQFVGRSFNVFMYRELLQGAGVSSTDELGVLLFALGTRGFVIGYTFGNSDGIHGWLTNDETQRLATLLSQLSLPQVDATFAAMQAAHRGSMIVNTSREEWTALSLSFLRNVALIAAGERKAVLWGNDLPLGFLK